MAGERVIDAELEIFRDDGTIDSIQPGDTIEFAPIIEEDGPERVSWVTSDARPDELGPVEGRWDGEVVTTLVMEVRRG